MAITIAGPASIATVAEDAPMVIGPCRIVYDTPDANAHALKFNFPASSGTRVPVALFGIGIEDVDLGASGPDFAGVLQPTLGVVDLDRDAALVMDFSADDAARLRAFGPGVSGLAIAVSAGAITLTPTTDVNISAGRLFLNETSNARMTVGVTVQQGANDDEVFAAKSSDIAHGRTGRADTDAWWVVEKSNATLGGGRMVFLAEDAATTAVAQFTVSGGTATNAKSTAAVGLYNITLEEHNGANAAADIAADGNIWAITAVVGGSFVCRVLIDEDGDIHAVNNTITAFDDYPDDLVARAGQAAMAPEGHWMRREFKDLIAKYADLLEEHDIIHFNRDTDGVAFVNHNKAIMFAWDGLYQLGQRLRRIESYLNILPEGAGA